MRRRSGWKSLVLAGLAAAVAAALLGAPAGAVWHNVLVEHFSGSAVQWNTVAPWGNWAVYPPTGSSGPPWTWGVTDYIYKVNNLDEQSLWCCGKPPTLDPEFNTYPTNMGAWVKWGPFSLAQAVAARAYFWYYIESEPIQDFLRWGAYNQNQWNMFPADTVSGVPPQQWHNKTMEFDSLGMGGSVSLLGQNTVWLLFHFQSDGDLLRDMGAFIDEVTISWDDGTIDLEAEQVSIARLDSTSIVQPFIGDSVRFRFLWSVEGSGVTPPFDITCAVDGNVIYTERRTAAIGGSGYSTYETFSSPWQAVADTHGVVWTLDTQNEIAEAREDNNVGSLTFQPIPPNVPPWIEVLRPTWGDTAGSSFVIRWIDEDPDNNAHISLFWNIDSVGTGVLIPGAVGIDEDDEADSFLWNVSQVLEGPVWVYAVIEDGFTPTSDYSPGPLIVDHSWGINVPPAITLLTPVMGDTADSEFWIKWTDSDPDDDALINLYWDNNNTGTNGTPIPGAAGLHEDSDCDSFLWDVSGMLEMGVWVYAKIQDEGSPVFDYSPGLLVIDHTAGLPGWQTEAGTPGGFALGSVYPNPFNSEAVISFSLPHPSQATLRIYDSLGRVRETIFTGQAPAGYHQVAWRPMDLPSGLYLVELQAGGQTFRTKAVYMK
ncbi:MAG: T9SS C-terminal target domain-containing protein [Candidatus Zixiibacteriota bacterium]|nr:MAG: T9SS C-terminal target domain-containing protein [candidate division Zixibacteria bacterium]